MANKVHTEIIIDPSQLSPRESSKHLDELKRYIDSKSCYYSGPLNHAQITKIETKAAYQCRMKILFENRELSWTKKATKKRINHSIQPVFDIWLDYQFQLPISSEKKSEQKRSLSEHDYTSNCEVCQGEGNLTCTNHRCVNGSEKCLSCSQGLKSDGTRCSLCKDGLIICITCNGKGRLQCTKCEGCGAFLHSATLRVWWETRMSTWYYQDSFLPEDKIAHVNKVSMWSKSETPWTKESAIEDFVRTINEDNSSVPLKSNIVRDYKDKHLNETMKLSNQMRRLECDIERLDFEEIEYMLEAKYMNKKDFSRGNRFRFCQYSDAQGHHLIYENDYPLNSCGCMGGCCACYNCSCAIL
ncbi:unnamed protein product [Adineta ricciae]|uniref:Uncharacterized protein n=1 Tax=Adineta ricciae TaxID=249248 RepID=A0A813TBN4_ADIRI|nr:unnamed protein product [Adineta ricciae]